jgi:shikimate kinase
VALSNVVLIGFMGCGKTTVGKTLSEKLNFSYTDTDNLIEIAVDMPIKEIFNQLGESNFRDLEAKICATLPSFDSTVISTGGGIIERVENRAYIKEAGKVVYLRASFDSIVSRIGSNKDRPLFREDLDKVNLLYETRLGIYSQLSDITVDTDGISQSQVADTIADVLK